MRAQENRAINLSVRSSEPLTPLNTNNCASSSSVGPLLNIPNPNAFWPKREELSTAFRPLASATSPAVASSGDSSQNSSPLDFSNWRLRSDYSVQRLFGNPDSASPFANTMSHMARVGSDENRTALMAVAAAISAAAASAAVSAANDRSISVPPSAHSPSPNEVARRGPRHSRGPRRSTPSMSSGSMMPHAKSSSPTNTGANWKSRQPTECDYCKRMFSNKFNLKQVRNA